MLRPKSTLSLCLMLMSVATSACSTLAPVQVAQIPLRADLRQCEVLPPIPFEAMPPVSADAAVRAVQIEERAFWMRRDISQADVVKDACEKAGELVALIEANNAGIEE